MIARNRKRRPANRKLHLENLEARHLLAVMLANTADFGQQPDGSLLAREVALGTAVAATSGGMADALVGKSRLGPDSLQGSLTDAGLQRVVRYMDALGISSLDELGTIEITEADSAGFQVTSGVYLLRPNSLLQAGSAFPGAIPDATGWSAATTPWTGAFETASGGLGASTPSRTPLTTGKSLVRSELRGEMSHEMTGEMLGGWTGNIMGAAADEMTLDTALRTAVSQLPPTEPPVSGDAFRAKAAGATGLWLTPAGGVPRVCFAAPAAARQGANPATSLSAPTAGLGLGLAASSLGTVVQFTGNQTTDTAVILADRVILDAATVTLSDSIREFIIVANTIESRDHSKIRWVNAYTQAPSQPDLGQASQGQDYEPTETGSTPGADGGDGRDGQNGANGYDGDNAPSVSIYVKEFLEDTTNEVIGYLSFPTLDVRGQHGGAGQDGQDGGDGGDGAKGRAAEGRWYECHRGAGYGGDGGDGGDGGNGGDGGDGGDGGTITINFVEFPDRFYLTTAAALEPFLAGDLLVDGGWGGAGGLGGAGGDGGDGGEPGNADGIWCREEPERAGEDGGNGASGAPGAAGSAGNAGSVTLNQIDLATWEAAFTAPYLLSASPTEVYVGQTVVFSTANFSDGHDATLIIDDDLDGIAGGFDPIPLEELGDNQFAWEVSQDLTASHYTLYLQRDSDGEETKETNTYRIELKPVVTEVFFADEYDARPGGTAYVLGYGFRQDSRIIYDGQYIETTDSGTDGSSAEIAGCPSGFDWLQFRIPVGATDGEHFVRDAGTTHSVYLDQVESLVDSDTVSLTLKKHAGLTFLPSTHGYSFSNGQMADASQDYVGDYDDPTTSVNDADTLDTPFSDVWNAFLESYGVREIEAMGGWLSPEVWVNFLMWYAWWSADASATCLGLSAWVLKDYFLGITGQPETDVWDAQYNVMLTQSHLLSDEVLGSLAFQTVLEGVSASAATEATVNEIVSFFQEGGDAGDAPVIVMIPELSTYTDVIYNVVNLVAGSVVALGYALNPFDATTAGEAWDAITDVASELAASVRALVDGISLSHALAPYMAVYDEPDDALPARLYFYDSNLPQNDNVYMEIAQDGDGDVTFDYSMADHFFPDRYVYGTPDGWVLASGTVDYLMADPDLLYDGDNMLEVIYHALTNSL